MKPYLIAFIESSRIDPMKRDERFWDCSACTEGRRYDITRPVKFANRRCWSLKRILKFEAVSGQRQGDINENSTQNMFVSGSSDDRIDSGV